MTGGRAATRLGHLRRLAYWLDNGIPIPGTGLRIGLDPILGLIPGVGDAAGAVLSLTILGEAVRRGIPRAALTRMATNIAIDAAAGAVPLIGDLFDAGWKANARNVAILERYQSGPLTAHQGDRLFAIGVTGGLLLLLAAGVFTGAYLGLRLFESLASLLR